LSSPEIISESLISIFPNPSHNDVTITSTVNMLQLEIVDLNGKIKLSTHVNSQNAKLNLDTFESGVYFIRVETENSVSIEKFIKN